VHFLSCQNEQDFLNEKEDETDSFLLKVPVEHEEIIQQLGLDITTLVDKGDDYQLEGDIMLSKNEMSSYVYQHDSTSKLKQGYIRGQLVNLINAPKITIYIDPSIPTSGIGSDWRQAVQRAVSDWNNINGTCLRFALTTSSKANITVKRTFVNNSDIAWTWLPSNGIPAKEIYVNSNFDDYPTKANTLTHEMGHSIGLLHAHQSAASQGGTVIPGMADIDNTSIMSYNRNRFLLPGFNNNDLIAIRWLYPANLPYLKVKEEWGNYVITFTNYGGIFSKWVSWSVSGASCIDPTTLMSSNSIEVKPTSILKNVPITVTAYDSGRNRAICTVTFYNKNGI